MSRHERRKVKIFETKRLSVAELSAAWQLCAWNGCQSRVQGRHAERMDEVTERVITIMLAEKY